MPTRLKIMLAVLLGVGLLMLFDSPPEPEVVGVGERPRRPQAVQAPAAPLRAPSVAVDPDAPVPDLFAGGPAQAVRQDAAVTSGGPDAGDKPQTPFVLLGFKVEDGVREAYLLRNDAVLLARAGSVFEKRYRVLALRQESVRIQDQQTGEEHRISFGTEE
ncbi:hypothetical protein F2P45_02055 [Massilia sp. CCM 8733]|uniref:Type II secretion system protein GspC N-terminal domain-containing protein n=1 Tax=Massilia mucilaginosa TaxID=2609282 RepID=A0ABX0NM05_9BURK|nr:hypothetical protein [Massilia mucilaginosa]NHZ87819.1 hypothetical protein [Massilia mucilaginosa]